MDETYLGDGLYASFDGFQYCLRAPREGGDHVVYLDAYTLQAFDEYRRECELKALAEARVQRPAQAG